MADLRSLIDTYAVYINGRWVEPDMGRYDDVNPATEAVIASVPDPSHAQVGSAIAAARAAFDSGSWPGAGPEQRAGFLNQLGEALLAHADEFYALAQQEWGCTSNERVIHVEGPAFAALNAAELATHPVEEPIDAFGAAGKTLLRYEPLGVVSILTPWNFPHTLNVMKVCAALTAGN
ncbi:MAG: aldehyde dehydrogenase family protein, partial [Mycobacterium sp.]